MDKDIKKVGCLNAPDRHGIDWRSDDYFNEEKLFEELERVYDICHGCRRCVNLCHSFPTLFDLIDASETMEVDGVDKADYFKPVEHCYLCDRCYMVKCPYVPPHEWNVDFPHLMLRAKAYQFKQQGASLSNKILTSTDTVGKLASIPVVSETVNALNHNKIAREVLAKTLNVHPEVTLPKYYRETAQKRLKKRKKTLHDDKVLLFMTCYGNYNAPVIVDDLAAILTHNDFQVDFLKNEKCCGMPKLELGDFEAVEKMMEHNIQLFLPYVEKGYTIVAPIPSCVLMFKQELPLMFMDNENVRKVRDAYKDPFELLWERHRAGQLKLDFKETIGHVFYHQPCHSQVQNIGSKVKDVLNLIPETRLNISQRCSGHDGTYGVKVPYYEISLKIGKPIATEILKDKPTYYTSDCPMAAQHIADNLHDSQTPLHPLTLLRKAYGI